MKILSRVSVQIAIALAASSLWSQPIGRSTSHFEGTIRGPEKEIGALLDLKEHRAALSREIVSERDAGGQLNVLKACADVGIICGIELNPEMLKLLNALTLKRYTLYSLFRGTLGQKAKVSWRLQEHVGRATATGYSPFYVLTVRPKTGTTHLDKSIVWNVGNSGGAKWDTYDLGGLIGIPVKRPSLIRRHSGIVGNNRIRLSARDALNHIAANTENSWQVVYSSGSRVGVLSVYPGE